MTASKLLLPFTPPSAQGTNIHTVKHTPTSTPHWRQEDGGILAVLLLSNGTAQRFNLSCFLSRWCFQSSSVRWLLRDPLSASYNSSHTHGNWREVSMQRLIIFIGCFCQFPCVMEMYVWYVLQCPCHAPTQGTMSGFSSSLSNHKIILHPGFGHRGSAAMYRLMSLKFSHLLPPLFLCKERE